MKKRRIKAKILYIILILQVILLLITGKNINTFNGLFILYYIQLYFIYRIYKEIEGRI